MIFYFSGTGSSKWIAEEIAKGIEEKVVNIAEMEPGYVAEKDEVIGLVFPVYAWGPPEIVMKFAKKIELSTNYTFVVCTCGSDAGKTINLLEKVFTVKGAWSIAMPSNYIPQAMDSPETIKEKIKTAQGKIPNICASIKNSEVVRKVEEGSGAFLKSKIVNKGFNKFARGTGPFIVEENCIGCGKCVEVCHMKLITLKDNKPQWEYAKCSQCLACINVCPEKAIVFGNKKHSTERFWFERDGAKYL